MKKLTLTLPLIFLFCTSIKAQFGSGNLATAPTVILNLGDCADIDNDGMDDIITSQWNSPGNIFWYKNLGGGVFSSENVVDTGLTFSGASTAVDVDNDGHLDIITGVLYLGIVWNKNLGGGVFLPYQVIASGITNFVVKDIDGDNLPDLIVDLSGQIGWMKNNGGGNFGAPVANPASSYNAMLLDYKDMDNDGYKDIIASYKTHLMWFSNSGTNTFTSTGSVSFGGSLPGLSDPTSMVVDDFDNDGDYDILVSKDDKVYQFTQGATSFSSPVNISQQGYQIKRIYTEDLNYDGYKDIICVSYANNDLIWVKNLGGNFGNLFQNRIVIDGNINGPLYVSTGDLDNDGDIEILAYSHTDIKLFWYENYFSNPQLSGKLFYDENQNAMLDSAEVGLPFAKAVLSPSTLFSYSDINGDYKLYGNNGVNTVSYEIDSAWNLTTDSTTYTYNLNAYTQLDSLNFGFFPDTVRTIINPELTGDFPRCNRINNYWINIRNMGTTIPNGLIYLQLDDSIGFVSAEIAPDSIIGQNIYWNYDSLFFFTEVNFKIEIQMPSFTSIGDTLKSYLTVTELDSLNNVVYSNTKLLDQILVCAYDPNDKQVTPKGVGLEGFITADEEYLEYLIRFQNTGNDTAVNVMIRDLLSTNLDRSTLQVLAASHPIQSWIEQDDELVFKFEDIMLPDSNVNEPSSHGFVKFKIALKPNLAPNIQIPNTGNIYFDYNPPVITNTVLNTIYSCNETQITINTNTICRGEDLTGSSNEGSISSYLWEIDTFFSSTNNVFSWTSDTVGTFNLKLTINNLFCLKDTTVSITIYPSNPITNTNQSICQGDSMLIYGSYQSVAGTYYDSLQTINGCDSVLSITLSVNPVYLSNTNDTICQGDSVLIYGNYENTAGVYYDSLQSILGCDSVLTTTLFLNANFNTSQNQEICQGDSVLIYGNYENTAGTYYDSLQTINGCDSVLSTTLTVNSLPNVTLNNFNPDTICSSSSAVALPNGSPSGGVYSGTGVNGGTFDPSISGVGTHSVIYTYTDVNSCINSDSIFITVEQCVGMDDLANDLGILIYPNPNTGLFTIEKPIELDKEVNISLLDASSRVIIDKVIPKGQQKIEMDITSYSKGIYYLQITIGDKMYVKQILKN